MSPTGGPATWELELPPTPRTAAITNCARKGRAGRSLAPPTRPSAASYNPEELLLGALSACHMLWVLHLCADAGIVITEYTDPATGEMLEHADGSGQFTRVTLHPRMTITDGARIAEALAMHDRAHHVCCLARSVNFPVEHEPVVTEASR